MLLSVSPNVPNWADSIVSAYNQFKAIIQAYDPHIWLTYNFPLYKWVAPVFALVACMFVLQIAIKVKQSVFM